MKKNIQEKIDRYLRNEMAANEKAAFEKEVAQNAEWKAQLALSKDLSQFFAKRNPALEQELTHLDDIYFANDKSQSHWKKWLLGIVGIFLIGIVGWLMSDFLNNPVENASPKVIEEKVPNSEEVILEKEVKEVQPELEQVEEEIKVEKKEAVPPKKEQPKKTQPIAALNPEDFKVNPVLEGLIAERVRDESVKTEIETPNVDAILKYARKTQLIVKGTTNAAPPYQLTIFSNKPTDFDNDRKYLRTELSYTENDDDYVFMFNANIDFKKGLYYFLIESVETDDLLVVSKFQVK